MPLENTWLYKFYSYKMPLLQRLENYGVYTEVRYQTFHSLVINSHT